MPTKKPVRDQRSAKRKKRDAYTVVLEDINSKLEALGEGQKLNRQLTNERFERIEHELKRLDRIESRLIRVEEKVDKTSEGIAEIKTELQKIRQQLTQKISPEEFQALERRVGLLEQKIATG